jgi:hypothetical protein
LVEEELCSETIRTTDAAVAERWYIKRHDSRSQLSLDSRLEKSRDEIGGFFQAGVVAVYV